MLRDKDDHRCDYHSLGPKNIKKNEIVVPDAMRPAAHAHVLCSVLQFAFLYEAFSLDKSRVEASCCGKL